MPLYPVSSLMFVPQLSAQACFIHKRYIIPTEKKRRHNGTADKHIDILRKQVKSKFHGRILLVITEVQFIFRFRKIKWRPVTFCKCTNQENQEANRLVHYIPSRHWIPAVQRLFSCSVNRITSARQSVTSPIASS